MSGAPLPAASSSAAQARTASASRAHAAASTAPSLAWCCAAPSSPGAAAAWAFPFFFLPPLTVACQFCVGAVARWPNGIQSACVRKEDFSLLYHLSVEVKAALYHVLATRAPR